MELLGPNCQPYCGLWMPFLGAAAHLCCFGNGASGKWKINVTHIVRQAMKLSSHVSCEVGFEQLSGATTAASQLQLGSYEIRLQTYILQRKLCKQVVMHYLYVQFECHTRSVHYMVNAVGALTQQFDSASY